jgi:hypothetical protein
LPTSSAGHDGGCARITFCGTTPACHPALESDDPGSLAALPLRKVKPQSDGVMISLGEG